MVSANFNPSSSVSYFSPSTHPIAVQSNKKTHITTPSDWKDKAITYTAFALALLASACVLKQIYTQSNTLPPSLPSNQTADDALLGKALVAAGKGDLETMQALIKAGFNVSQASVQGRTALHVATLYNQKQIAKALLEAGANVNATDNNGRIPLHLAAKNNLIKLVNMFIAAKANLNTTDKKGQTPLHLAAMACLPIADPEPDLPCLPTPDDCQSHRIIGMLIEAGAKPDPKDKEGKTPLQRAFDPGKGNNDKAFMELLKRGASF